MNFLVLLLSIVFFSQGALAQAEQHATGLIQPRNWQDNETFYTLADVPLPQKFDWRDLPGGLPPVRNQGRCGSCWAFGTSGALELAVAIRGGKIEHLSEQQLLSCNGQGYSCDGGFFVHEYQMNPGQAFDSDFPYTAKDIACKPGLPSREKLSSWAYIGGSDTAQPTTAQIKQALYQNGPVTVTIAADSVLQKYKTGVISQCNNEMTNHMVVIVGWNDVDVVDGQTGYWIVRNSWGDKWGDKGYFKIKYGCSSVGQTATTVVYKPTCQKQPRLISGKTLQVHAGESVTIGTETIDDISYSWKEAGKPFLVGSSNIMVYPTKTTSYTLVQETACGKAETSFKINITD